MSRKDFGDVHAGHLDAESVAIDAVTVPERVARSCVPRECLRDLGCSPRGSRILGNVEMDNAPALMCQSQEDRQKLEVNGGDDEELD